MKNVDLAFKKYEKYLDPQELQNNKKILVYLEIDCHKILDIKNLLMWKARYVAAGHTNGTLVIKTYSNVVSQESVRFAFLIAFHLHLKVLLTNIGNIYVVKLSRN